MVNNMALPTWATSTPVTNNVSTKKTVTKKVGKYANKQTFGTMPNHLKDEVAQKLEGDGLTGIGEFITIDNNSGRRYNIKSKQA
jgi:hypothetical protein